MSKYYRKSPYSKPSVEYLLSISPDEYIAADGDKAFNFRGRCRIYFLVSLIEGKKQ